MAEYLIQSETLDDIADAINAKTGGSSAMTPAQMVTAIAAIPSGGDPWELIADYTSDEAANVVVAEIPEGKQMYKNYRVQYLGTASAGDYPRPTVNGYVNSYTNSNSVRNLDFMIYVSRAPSNALVSHKRLRTVWGGANLYLSGDDAPLQSVGISPYNTSTTYGAGFNIKVWRLVEP